MDQEAFRLRVVEETEGCSPKARACGLNDYCRRMREFTESDVQCCVAIIKFLDRKGLLSSSAREVPSVTERVALPSLLPAPTARVLSAEYRRKMQPWVEKLRRQLTGSAAPPCHAFEEVMPWCQEADRASGAQLLSGWERWEDASPDGLVMTMLQHVYQRTERRGVLQWRDYVVHQDGEPPLAYLERETRQAARITEFRQVDLVAYVLVGILPVLRAAAGYYHSLYQPDATCGVQERRSIVVELPVYSVLAQEFRTLERLYRQALGLAQKKAFTDLDATLMDVVEQLGGEPPRGRGRQAFWEKVKEEVNRKMEEQHYKAGNNAKKQYRRLMQRLDEMTGQTSTSSEESWKRLGLTAKDGQAIEQGWQAFMKEGEDSEQHC